MKEHDLDCYEKSHNFLFDILKTGSETKELKPFMESFFKSLGDVFDIIGGGVYLSEKPDQSVRLYYSRDLPEEILEKHNKIPIFKKIYNKIFDQSEIYLTNKVKYKKGGDKASCSTLFFPIFSRGEVCGAVVICKDDEFDTGLENIKLFKMIGYIVGNIIERLNIEKKCSKAYNELYLYENNLNSTPAEKDNSAEKHKSAMKEVLDYEIYREKRYNNGLSVILFDIDKLTKVNSKHGTEAGDEVISEIIKVAENSIRKCDYLFRYDGGTFMVLLTNTKSENAIELAERIRIKIKDKKFKHPKSVTCSFGVTQIHHNDSYETVVQRSNKILHTAKHSGRNNVVFAS